MLSTLAEAVRRLAQHAQRGALIPASNTAFRSNLLPSVHYWRSYVKTAAAASAAAVGDASDAGSGAAVPVLLGEVQVCGFTCPTCRQDLKRPGGGTHHDSLSNAGLIVLVIERNLHVIPR